MWTLSLRSHPGNWCHRDGDFNEWILNWTYPFAVFLLLMRIFHDRFNILRGNHWNLLAGWFQVMYQQIVNFPCAEN